MSTTPTGPTRPPGRRRRRRGPNPDGLPRDPAQQQAGRPRDQRDGRPPRREGGRPPRPQEPRPPALPPPPPQEVRALAQSHLDRDKGADVPLSPDEVVEMRQHLRFLFKNRQLLRLKVNATEDLLLNGVREPTHRGQCVHLLGKVDSPSVTSALSRLEDPKARAALLGGIVRFSTDVGVLLLFLESLSEASSRTTAAAAFGAAIQRIEFEGLSSARMRRVLELIASTFDGHERVQVLFGLLQSKSFRRAFERTSDALPDSLADLFVPLTVVHEVVIEGRPNRHGLDLLTRGVTMLLDAPKAILQSHPLPVKERLLENAVRLVRAHDIADRAEDALLLSLPPESRTFSSLGMLRAAELLRRHEDARARPLLEAIRQAHPGFQMPGRWLAALDAPRVGRFAWLGWAGGTGRDEQDSERGRRLQRAFWLDLQRIVWLRVASAAEASTVLAEVELQRTCAIAGIAPLSASGVTEDGAPYVALPCLGRPADVVLARWRPSRSQAFAAALTGTQALFGLALLGIRLPDADPARFLLEETSVPAVFVADLSGAQRVGVSAGLAAHHQDLARSWCKATLQAVRQEEIPPEARATIEGAQELAAFVQALAMWT